MWYVRYFRQTCVVRLSGAHSVKGEVHSAFLPYIKTSTILPGGSKQALIRPRWGHCARETGDEPEQQGSIDSRIEYLNSLGLIPVSSSDLPASPVMRFGVDDEMTVTSEPISNVITPPAEQAEITIVERQGIPPIESLEAADHSAHSSEHLEPEILRDQSPAPNTQESRACLPPFCYWSPP